MMSMKRTQRLYICDPAKATDCPRTACAYITGTTRDCCHLTVRPEWAAAGADGEPLGAERWTEFVQARYVLETLNKYLSPALTKDIMAEIMGGVTRDEEEAEA